MDEFNASVLLRGANLFVGGVCFLCGLAQLFSGFKSFIFSSYALGFGALVVYSELRRNPLLVQYCSFLYSFLSRGVAYLLFGTIISGDKVLEVIPGFLVALIGILYICLEFFPSVELPESMRADPIADFDEEF